MRRLLYPIALLSRRKRLYHFWPMFLYMLLYLLWFHLIEAIPRTHYLAITLPIDRVIPFVEVFVIPYVSWFMFVAVGIIGCYYADRDTYDSLCTSLILGMTTFLIVSTFLPNRQPLRLIEMPRDNIFTRMIATLWRSDTPTNVWPSIHVFNTAAVEMAILKSDHPTFRKPVFRVLLTIWSILIILSTVFIKQHSMFDVLTALFLIVVCYIRIYRENAAFRFRKWDAFALAFEEEAYIDMTKRWKKRT